MVAVAALWMPLPAESAGSGMVGKMIRNHTVAKSKNSEVVSNSTSRDENSTVVTTPSPSSSGESRKREVTKLPLENLFPTVSTKVLENEETKPVIEKAEDRLRKALLNHSLHINDMDKDLDQLVFSQLPEGSKLILRTVKIVRTDDDGNEEDSGEERTAWDVVVSNGTNDEPFSDEEMDGPKEISDLLGAASHARSQYKDQGTSHKTKEKDTKYYLEQDHGKAHKQTLTDTEGKKKTDYEGGEKGITDFAKSHGNSQSNEGGRYKDSKKKNKGRKVTGFKRVYHKEEFQRTEHFYDDEEAKRIAESFGANDQKEKSAHGIKNDDRKYHGTYKEKTDGQKVKNEHETKNGYNKGHHEHHKNTERHTHGQKYQNDKSQGSPAHGEQYHRPKYHENHNYHGAYSSTNTRVTSPVAASEQLVSTLSTTSPAPPLMQSLVPMPSHSHSDPSPRPRHNRPLRLRQPNFSASTVPKPNIAMTAPQQVLKKPKEMKVFFSPRERHFPFSPNDVTMAYAPNFIPGHASKQQNMPPVSYGYNFRTIHPLKPLHGFKIRNESYGINNRYAATGMEVSTIADSEAVAATTEKQLKHPLSGRPQVGWVPVGSNKYPVSDTRPHGNNYPQFTHLRVGKTLVPTMLIRSPSTNTPSAVNVNNNPRRPPAYIPSGQPSTLSYSSTHSSHNNQVKRNPQFSHFMNGLMDSVAGFFGRMG
ncbi:unnamed protein product [Allacma fusca]|uniref:Uncharacterized protein n=1 Tax=Allacma fusca TaxID=39272 RepID=A0A8J2L548_9HEXA|nr:unnamed protein product [Allacma fusca]